MVSPTEIIKNRFTRNEELANAISHGIGFIFAIVGAFFILNQSVKSGNNLVIISNAIFSGSMILLYLSSTLNHTLKTGKAKEFFHNFDQIAIYLLIAGTYTPLALIVLHNDWGWLMFGIQWSIALVGIVIKYINPNQFEKGVQTFTIISYVLMGWLLLFFIVPIIKNINLISFFLIIIGGFFYTLGIIFFKIKKLPFAHLIWHIMVIAGTFCHYLAIFLL